MDLVSRVETAPERGETVFGAGFVTAPGGKGLNQAVAAARLGADAALVSRVGDDVFGRQLLDACDAEGVDRAHVSVDAESGSGVSLVIVDAGGENRIVANARANASLEAGHVDAAFEGAAPAAALLCHEAPDAPLVRAAELARRAGAWVVFNAAPAGSVPAELMELTDVVVVNESEAAALTGIAPTGREEALRAARALVGLGPGAAAVTLGAAGSVVFSREDGGCQVEAFASEAVDATGAGDAFCGALTVGLCAGVGLADAARLGNAAGALAARVLGAAPSMPRRAAVFGLADVAALRGLQ